EVIRVSMQHDDVAYLGRVEPERFETGKKNGLDLLRVSGIDQDQPFTGFYDVDRSTDAPHHREIVEQPRRLNGWIRRAVRHRRFPAEVISGVCPPAPRRAFRPCKVV